MLKIQNKQLLKTVATNINSILILLVYPTGGAGAKRADPDGSSFALLGKLRPFKKDIKRRDIVHPLITKTGLNYTHSGTR